METDAEEETEDYAETENFDGSDNSGNNSGILKLSHHFFRLQVYNYIIFIVKFVTAR